MVKWKKTALLFLKNFLMVLVFVSFPGKTYTQTDLPSFEYNAKEKIFLDSLLINFSIEELVRFKDFYSNEINLLAREIKLHREKGISDGEKIFSINPDAPFMDKVLFRLAEFYYLQEQDELFQRMEKYEQEFVKYEAGELVNPPEEPKPDYSNVIDKYELIVNNFPESLLMDDVLYHLAFTYDKNYEPEKAVTYFKQLADNYPESRNAPEALIRIGEYYFDFAHRDLAIAIQYYSQVLFFKDTPRFSEALYKLGWCYYLQENYDSSIATFTILVQDIEKNVFLDPSSEYTNPSLKDEALEYIGICFHDEGGLPGALAFIDSLGRPEYGTKILGKMGDIYRDNEENYLEAINTFSALLQRFPNHNNAPEFQEKIVLCARKLEDEGEIFLAQQQLFDKYHPGSEWSQQVKANTGDPEILRDVLNEAHQKSEFALRDNINRSIRLGEESQDPDYFQSAVENGKKYLATFPYDTSAYTIHWNMAVIMDTKLDQKKNAYQEYLNICDNYIQDKFKKFAAQNAIVLANEMNPATSSDSNDSLSVFAVAEVDSIGNNGQNGDDLHALPIDQTLLIASYDNFIKHFPQREETAVVLGNVGNLYYSDKNFNVALRYFNTLLRRFPESASSRQAQLTAMESYFGKQDFASAEIIAKRIQGREDLPEEFRAKAGARLAESIYLHAESLAADEEHLKSANEFKRVIEEVPDAKFLDKALFQAGVQYDLAKEYGRAVEMYSQLTSQFSESDHYLDAVNNLALDYGELKDFLLAARTYETLSKIQTDSKAAQDALYNSSYFYVQAKDWRNSILINRQYVDLYPGAKDAEDMFYNIAGYYLKIDDYDHANEIYGEFAAKYPESPRAVETYFKRGDYLFEKGRMSEAFVEFDLALSKNRELKSKNLPTNDFYAAEALFKKSEEQYKEFLSISFSSANLDYNQQQKKDLLQRLVKQYNEVASFGTIRIYEVMYKVGRLYENFADTWAAQQSPALAESEQIVFVNNLNLTSAKLYDRSFDSYKSNYKFLHKLVNSYQPVLQDSSEENSQRVVSEDSTVRVASRWITLTGTKISEMLYKIAELNSSSIERFLSTPLPAGLDQISSLEYRNQVLAKVIFPIVQKNTAAHLRNLNEADSLQIQNVWVERSQQKLSEIMDVLPSQFKQLCLDAFDTYDKNYREYKKIMTEGTPEQKENAIDLAGKLINIIDLSKNYASLMIANYKVSIENLIKNESGQLIAQALLADCINTTLQLAGNFNGASADCRNMKDHFTILNQRNPQMVYEDAIFTFSDGESYLLDNALEMCKATYEVKQQYDFPALEFASLASLMVELDPNTYAKEFGLPVEEFKLVADPTWLMSVDVADSNWMLPDFSDTGWQPAFIQSDPVSQNDPVILSNISGEIEFLNDSLSTGLYDSSMTIREIPGELYLRKEISINDIPLSAMFIINADDNVWIYLNGIEVFSETAAEIGWGNVFETDITQFLKTGKNTIAIKVEDSDNSGNGVQPVLKIQTILRDRLIQHEQKLFQNELNNFGITNLDVLIYNRYIIPQ